MKHPRKLSSPAQTFTPGDWIVCYRAGYYKVIAVHPRGTINPIVDCMLMYDSNYQDVSHRNFRYSCDSGWCQKLDKQWFKNHLEMLDDQMCDFRLFMGKLIPSITP